METGARAGRLVVAMAILAVAGCGSSKGRPAIGPTSQQRHSAPTGQQQTAPTAQQLSAPGLAAVQGVALIVFDDYERAGAAVKTGEPRKPPLDDLATQFVSAEAQTKFVGAGGTDAPMGCGGSAAKDTQAGAVVDGVLIGTPVASQNSISLPVSLYRGTKEFARVSVTADSTTGKLKDFTCGPAAAQDLPGVQALVGFYGGVAATGGASAKDAIATVKRQFVAERFASFARPDVDADQATCSEDDMPYWHAVYAPTATTTGAQWYFWPGGQDRVSMSVAVDSSANRIAWVYCFGELVPRPAPGAYSDDQVQAYVGDLFNAYAYLLALKPFGADPSGIAAYFASDAAYKTALGSTGAQPLECSATLAGSIGGDSVTVTGTTAVVTMTSAPSGHPLQASETALGHPKAALDLATMALTSVSCG